MKMNKNDIKRVIGRLEPDHEMEYRLSEKLRKDLHRRVLFTLAKSAAIAAGLIAIIGAGVFANSHINGLTKAKIGIKSQPGNSSVALLPDNKSTDKSDTTSHDSSADNSSSMLPNTKPNDKSDTNSQDNSVNNSSALLPDNKPTDRPDITSQGGSVNNSSLPLSENKIDEKSGSGTNSAADRLTPPKSETNLEPQSIPQNSVGSLRALLTVGINDQNEGIHVPKIQLSEGSKITAKMLGLIVYQGRIYTQSASPIDSKSAEKLVEEKLGTTKGTITDWSNQDDYAVELASTVGIQDVYAVKGYDKSFRIMTYGKINGEVYANFFDCLNDVTVKTGNDIFGKFKIENNIESISFEDFDSWNNGQGNYKSLTKLDGFDRFLAALESSIPYDQAGLSNLFDDQSASNQKFVYIKLYDGSKVQLRLFKGGYVYYNGVNIFFKVDGPAFNSFWNELNAY